MAKEIVLEMKKKKEQTHRKSMNLSEDSIKELNNPEIVRNQNLTKNCINNKENTQKNFNKKTVDFFSCLLEYKKIIKLIFDVKLSSKKDFSHDFKQNIFSIFLEKNNNLKNDFLKNFIRLLFDVNLESYSIKEDNKSKREMNLTSFMWNFQNLLNFFFKKNLEDAIKFLNQENNGQFQRDLLLIYFDQTFSQNSSIRLNFKPFLFEILIKIYEIGLKKNNELFLYFQEVLIFSIEFFEYISKSQKIEYESRLASFVHHLFTFKRYLFAQDYINLSIKDKILFLVSKLCFCILSANSLSFLAEFEQNLQEWEHFEEVEKNTGSLNIDLKKIIESAKNIFDEMSSKKDIIFDLKWQIKSPPIIKFLKIAKKLILKSIFSKNIDLFFSNFSENKEIIDFGSKIGKIISKLKVFMPSFKVF